MNKVVEFLQCQSRTVFGHRWPRRKGQVPPLYVCRGVGRQAVVLHKQHQGCLQRYAGLTPIVEISVSSPEYAWLRLHGKAVFENNKAAKEMCIQNPIVKGQYGRLPTIPSSRYFIWRTLTRVIADFSGNPPYEF